MTQPQRAKTQRPNPQRLGWTTDQLVHLSRSLETGCDYGSIQDSRTQKNHWTTAQRLGLSAAMANLL